MKVELLVDCPAVNPRYNRKAAALAVERGKPYDVPPTVTLPAGTILEHPQAHMLCHTGHMNAPPRAKPADEEAERKHAEYLKLRDQRLRGLRLELRKLPKDRTARRHLLELAKAYGLEPGPADEPADAAN